MVILVMSGLLFCIAIPLLMGKGSFLITGYSEMSEEEKARYDVPRLSRFFGMVVCAAALCVLLWFLSTRSPDFAWLFPASMAAFLAVVLFAFVYAWQFKRFKK